MSYSFKERQIKYERDKYIKNIFYFVSVFTLIQFKPQLKDKAINNINRIAERCLSVPEDILNAFKVCFVENYRLYRGKQSAINDPIKKRMIHSSVFNFKVFSPYDLPLLPELEDCMGSDKVKSVLLKIDSLGVSETSNKSSSKNLKVPFKISNTAQTFLNDMSKKYELIMLTELPFSSGYVQNAYLNNVFSSVIHMKNFETVNELINIKRLGRDPKKTVIIADSLELISQIDHSRCIKFNIEKHLFSDLKHELNQKLEYSDQLKKFFNFLRFPILKDNLRVHNEKQISQPKSFSNFSQTKH